LAGQEAASGGRMTESYLLRQFYMKEYDKSWVDVYNVQDLEYKMMPEFMYNLRKASGRDR